MKGFILAFNVGTSDNVFAGKDQMRFRALQFWGEATVYSTRDEAYADAEAVRQQFNPSSIQIYHISDTDDPGNPMVDRKETIFGSASGTRYR